MWEVDCMDAQSLSCIWLFVTPWTVFARLLCLWNFPGKNTGVGCHFLLQRIFLTQGLSPNLLRLLQWQADSLPLHHQIIGPFSGISNLSKPIQLIFKLWCCFLLVVEFTFGLSYSFFFSFDILHAFTHYKNIYLHFSSSVVSDSLRPHGLQYGRVPCPSTTLRACSNSLSQWCIPTISSSVIPFFCFQYFLGSGSFQMSQFFTSGGQSTRVLTSGSVLAMNIQDWFSLGWTGWISLQSKGLSRVFSNTTVQKHQFFSYSAFFIVQLSHLYTTTGKTISLST